MFLLRLEGQLEKEWEVLQGIWFEEQWLKLHPPTHTQTRFSMNGTNTQTKGEKVTSAYSFFLMLMIDTLQPSVY